MSGPPLRIAITCRDLVVDSLTGSAANAVAAAVALGAAGHDVLLLSAELAGSWGQVVGSAAGVTWRPLVPERSGYVYFTDDLSYADRVYDTLVALHREAPLDVIDLPDTTGEAFTVLRARRLLGAFPQTVLAVSEQPWGSRSASADEPTHLASEVAAYTDAYAAAHADLVLGVRRLPVGSRRAPGPPRRAVLPGLPCLPGLSGLAGLAGPAGLDQHPSAPARGDGRPPAPTIMWLGALRAGAGLDTFLRAIEDVEARVPGLTVVVRGPDTPTDPLGRSFRDRVEAGLPDRLGPAVRFAGELGGGDLLALPPPGTPCVLASGGLGTPGEALLAMAAGLVVTAPRSSIGAAFVQDGVTGRVVPDGDAGALAAVLLDGVRDPAGRERLSEAARRSARAALAPDGLARRLEAAYRSVRRPRGVTPGRRARPSVSAVVPVYNRADYLPQALDSLRRAGVPDLEIVVVDDGSTDPAVAPLLHALDDVTLVEQRHRGLSAARNAGIRRCCGDLVLVIDDDDLVEPGFLGVAAESLRRCPDLGFVSGYVRYFGLLDFVQAPIGALGPLDLVLHTSLRSMVLFRRECLDAVGGYDEDLPAFEDWDIEIRLAFAGYQCDVLPVVGQHYRRHAGSMSFSVSNAMRCELVQFLVRKHAAKLTQQQLIRLLQNVVAFWKDVYEPSRSVMLQRERAT